MPIRGLEDVIVNILESLSLTHVVRTWNIFYEKNSEITVRLKFGSHVSSMENQGEGQVSADSTCKTVSYRRKSESQITRDRRRAERRYKNTFSNHSEKQLCSNNQGIQVDLSATCSEPDSFRYQQSSPEENPITVHDNDETIFAIQNNEQSFELSAISQESLQIPKFCYGEIDSLEHPQNFQNTSDLFVFNANQLNDNSASASANPVKNSTIADLDEFESVKSSKSNEEDISDTELKRQLMKIFGITSADLKKDSNG